MLINFIDDAQYFDNKKEKRMISIDKKATLSVNSVKKDSLPTKIISEIKSLIDSGQITHGSKLPGERDLSRMLNVSRPSLREALKVLNILGIIVHEHGKGTFLSADYEKWPLEPFSILFSLKKGSFLEIFETRQGLETWVVSLAAKRKSEEDLKKMSWAVENMRKTVNNVIRFYKYDNEFHHAIIAATKNEILIDLMKKIYKLTLDTREYLWVHADYYKINPKHDFARHEILFKHIAAGDANASAKCISKHLEEIRQRLKTGLIKGSNK